MKRSFTFKTLCLSFLTVFISILQVDAQCDASTCISQINVSLDNTICAVVITPDVASHAITSAAQCSDVVVQITGLESNSISDVGTYEYKLVNTVSNNSCWGNITVEDKSAPVLTCPIDITIQCSDDPSPENIAKLIAAMGMGNECKNCASQSSFSLSNNGTENAQLWGLDVLECSGYNLGYRDVFLKGGCDGDTIVRIFTAQDEYGYTTTCEQNIYLRPEDLTNLTLPNDFDCMGIDPDFGYAGEEMGGQQVLGSESSCGLREYEYGTVYRTGVLSCDGAGTQWNMLPNGNPSPDDKIFEGDTIPGTGKPGGISCGTIQSGYTDTRFGTCLDEFNQPCDANPASFKVLRDWTLLDWCTSIVTKHDQVILVMDSEAPEVSKIDDITVGTSLWDCSASVKLPIEIATDNCSSEVMVTYSSSAGTITDGVLSIADNAKTMLDTVKVYVEYSDCCGNSTLDTFSVTVIDDVPPVVVADAHTVVSLSEYQTEGLAKIFAETFDDGSKDNCGPIEMSVIRMDVCSGYGSELKHERKDNHFIHFCCEDVGETVMVEFRVCDDADMDGVFGGYWDESTSKYIVDAGDNCNTAMVEVEVQDKLAPACSVSANMSINCIEFAGLGDLVNSGALDSDGMARVNTMFGDAGGASSCGVSVAQELTSKEDCGLGVVTREVTVTNLQNSLSQKCEQLITITVDSSTNFLVCADISFPEGSEERKILGDSVWCETNPTIIGDSVESGANLEPIEVMACAGVNIVAPIIDYANLCSEVGIQLTLDTFDFAGGGCKKILAHWEIVDQCQFEENYFVNGEINPFVAENGYFELYVEYDLFDTTGPEITCGEGFTAECDASLVGSITATATDDCTADASFFGWNWKLDVDGDGSIDEEGEGNSIVPSDLGLTTFPVGQHVVTWIVSDGCGNLTSKDCPVNFGIVDSKAPTPYCLDGLSSAVMLENGVTIWAEDFNVESFDNCGSVFVTIVPENDVEGLSDEEAYAASLKQVLNTTTGKMEYGWNFTCEYIPNGISSTIEVRMYATDESGNKDYCTSSFRLQDNLGGCDDVDLGALTIAGNIQTVNDKMIGEVKVELMTSNPNFPKYTTTDEDGNYAFYGNPGDYDYEITAVKKDDYRNGVSTLDLLLIQKHLMGLEELTSAYDMIAADVNNDSTIKVSDLLQLRKLILGLYPENVLPNNDSWRFVAKESIFADEAQPWPFDEVGNVDELSTNMMTADFMAVKVGDVNNTVIGSSLGNSQVRNISTVTLEVNDSKYEAGDEVRLSFSSSEFSDVYGYQFTLEFEDVLDYVGIESGSLKLSEGNFGLNRVDEGVITTSYIDVKGTTVLSGEDLFTIVFKAKESSTISEAVKISSKVTAAEAYVGANLEVNNLELRTKDGESINGFSLLQNEPNPFKDLTNISFNLPEAGTATLTVYDVTGKVLRSVQGAYEKGLNTIALNGIDASGVMYYQLNAGEYSATKKMIVID